jgi:putative transposase
MFGEIIDFCMDANVVGMLVIACWNRLADDYPFVSLDTFVLMPNHLHGIIWRSSDNPSKKSLSGIVAAFKATSTSHARKTFHPNFKLWQRGFFEHVIWNDNDLFRIREYIAGNPVQWALDPENPLSKPDTRRR